MLVFQWNALRIGDRVIVHDDLDPGLKLREGVVTLVQTRRRRANEVGIRLGRQDSAMLRPRRHAVHLLPFEDRVPCWRCDAISARSTEAERQVAA